MFSLCAPSKTRDAVTITLADIQTFLDTLKPGLYVVGDAAYAISDKIIVPFISSQRYANSKDVFNYSISQIYIRINMALGLLKKQMVNNIVTTPLLTIQVSADLIYSCLSAQLCNYRGLQLRQYRRREYNGRRDYTSNSSSSPSVWIYLNS